VRADVDRSDQLHSGLDSVRNPPLVGIRVLDLTRVLSGPFATLLLADLGAEIIKVEHPKGGDETRNIKPSKLGQSHYFMSVNRNKKSMALDLKHNRGREIALDLCRHADVLVENFRPGVAERLGLGYDDARSVNSRLVYCSVSAFGQDGPNSKKPAFDLVVQAMSGLMHITGEPGRPPVRAGIPVGDLVAGLVADVGILAALADRERTGAGRYVDVAMLDSLVGMLTYYAGRFFMTGNEPERVGAGHLSVVPYGVFPCSDGNIVIAALSEAYWPRICEAVGRPDLAADARFSTNAGRVAHREEVENALSQALSANTVAHWNEVLEDADVPSAPILTIGQVLTDSHLLSRGMIRQLDHPLLGMTDSLGPIVRFRDADPPPAVAAPNLGEHTTEILRGVLGMTDSQISSLASSGVVGISS
jgi:crotonobetainyl-CoA:carnitine CoA-transferase CaiB-like acyl-CoA transferase